MLHFISWGGFIKGSLLMTALYYLFIGRQYFRKEIGVLLQRYRKKFFLLLPATVGLVTQLHAQTADGNAGISQANSLVRSYYQTGISLMYAISGVIALIGAVKVFSLWNGGHREEVARAAAGWFGSVVFIIIVATVLQYFFGL